MSAGARVALAMTSVLAVTIVSLVALAYLITGAALTGELDDVLAREAEAYAAAVQSAEAGDALVDATRAYLGGRGAGGTGPDVILLASFDATSAAGRRRVISNSELRLEDVPGNAAVRERLATPRRLDLAFQGETYRVLAVPIISRGEDAGVFEAAVTRSSVADTARRVALTLAAAGLLALGLALPLVWWASRGALRPLRAMAADAAAVSHAEPGRRIAYNGPADELGSLADSLNAMLARLERGYEEQRRFVADASHELRTPVAVIRGNAELLLRDPGLSADQAESLDLIEHETVRMSGLLEELLSLARYESSGRPSFQPLEISTLVTDVAMRARALAQRDFAVLGDCRLWAEGEPDLLDQAVVNLVRNAIAHTRDGGRIEITCRATGDSVLVTVTDDGPGIAEADLERVFDRFWRAEKPRAADGGGNAGLGLAITRRIVELHGGTVTVGNVAPHGAAFTITLPRISPPDGLTF